LPKTGFQSVWTWRVVLERRYNFKGGGKVGADLKGLAFEIGKPGFVFSGRIPCSGNEVSNYHRNLEVRLLNTLLVLSHSERRH
jgi:hypothetical protein